MSTQHPHPCAEAWRAMLDASRHPDSGVYVNAAGIAQRLGVGISGVGLFGAIASHREADALTRSNQAVALARLAELNPDGDAYTVERWHHPFVGWFEHTFVSMHHAGVVEYAADVYRRLDAYPVLDEMHWGELEWTEQHPEDDPKCYVDGGGCGCGRPSAYAEVWP